MVRKSLPSLNKKRAGSSSFSFSRSARIAALVLILYGLAQETMGKDPLDLPIAHISVLIIAFLAIARIKKSSRRLSLSLSIDSAECANSNQALNSALIFCGIYLLCFLSLKLFLAPLASTALLYMTRDTGAAILVIYLVYLYFSTKSYNSSNKSVADSSTLGLGLNRSGEGDATNEDEHIKFEAEESTLMEESRNPEPKHD